MNKLQLIRPLRTRPTVLALALLAAFGSAWAEDKAQDFDASATIGIGALTGNRSDRSLFDQYNGIRPGASAIGLFGADYYRRDDERGTTTQFQASDLLNGNRELDFRWKKQGDWKFSAGYRELLRQDFSIPNTGLVGPGSTTPQVVPLAGGPGTGSDMDLKTKRSSLGLGFSKVLSPQWQFDVGLQTEKKEGSRLFGVGMNCPSLVAPGCLGTTSVAAGWAVLMLPEPIDSNHTQAEARATFAGEKLSLSMGYYGSFYRNGNGSLNPNVPGSLYGPLGGIRPLATGLQPILNNAVALAPDNQAHQLDLTGGYAFTRTTRLNFKLGYSQASQQQSFASAGFTGGPVGVADLGGKLATRLAQIGITSRPMPKLSLNANLRYEHRSDSTPLALYNIEDTARFTNRQYPLTTTKAKVEAGYQFTSEYRGTLGATFNHVDRGAFTQSSAIDGVTALRQKTDETGLRAELRKRMSETLSGAVALETSKRTGSNWLRDNSGTGVTEITDVNSPSVQTVFAGGIFPVNLMDRRRDKVRLSADWQPNEKLSLQGVAELGRDRYDAPSIYGVHKSGMDQVSLDATYALSEKWNLTGFISHGRQELDQARPGAAFMAFDNRSTTLGLGATGAISSKIEVGGNLAWMNDRSTYAQTLDASADAGSAALLAATGGLPDIVFRQATLKVFGKYTFDKQSAVRLELVHQRSRWNDWAWGYNGTPFVYSDGTTINRKSLQNVSFLGVTYVRRWP
jgi:MtrB/PioB family decaheme-associated outer membrane protein